MQLRHDPIIARHHQLRIAINQRLPNTLDGLGTGIPPTSADKARREARRQGPPLRSDDQHGRRALIQRARIQPAVHRLISLFDIFISGTNRAILEMRFLIGDHAIAHPTHSNGTTAPPFVSSSTSRVKRKSKFLRWITSSRAPALRSRYHGWNSSMRRSSHAFVNHATRPFSIVILNRRCRVFILWAARRPTVLDRCCASRSGRTSRQNAFRIGLLALDEVLDAPITECQDPSPAE